MGSTSVHERYTLHVKKHGQTRKKSRKSTKRAPVVLVGHRDGSMYMPANIGHLMPSTAKEHFLVERHRLLEASPRSVRVWVGVRVRRSDDPASIPHNRATMTYNCDGPYTARFNVSSIGHSPMDHIWRIISRGIYGTSTQWPIYGPSRLPIHGQ